MNEARKQEYFSELAPQYDVLTGSLTKDIFSKYLSMHDVGLESSSVVHDNAAGPGTVSQVLVDRSLQTNEMPSILATDYAPGMIEALDQTKSANIGGSPAWAKVATKILNSSELSSVEDNYFTHSISNFSLFTITDAVKSLEETRRTLKDGGKAIVLLWKRYPVQHILAAAQDAIRGKGYASQHAVPVNGPKYFEEGVVAEQMIEAGFQEGTITTIVIEHLLSEGQKWDGLFKYLTSSSIAKGSTQGWNEEQVRAWDGAVKQAMLAEKVEYGGIFSEAWVTVATK